MDSSSGDFWYVKLSDGDVHRVTLDQLDEAFQAGHIDGDTMVLASGSSQWARLAAVAGMDEAEEEEEVAAAPQSEAEEEEAAYIPQLPRPAFAQVPAAVQPFAPSHSAPVAYIPQQARAIPQPAPYGVRPSPQPVIPPVIHPSFSPMPNTLRPMSVDFSDSDLEAMKMRRRGGGVMRWMVPVLALACIGGVGSYAVKTRPAWAQPLLNRMGFHADGSQAVAATMVPPSPAPPPPPAAAPAPPPAPPPPPVVAAPPPGDSPLNPKFSDQSTRLTDDQKARLAETDSKAKAKTGGRKAHGGGSGSHSSGGKKSTSFTTGGSKYDPLNSSI